jgi:RimJ/RimL family protein N-acetyltransferase
MRHSIHREAFGVRLRPVREDDAAFIVWLRNLDHAVGRVGDSATDITSQQTWLKAYFERAGDYYFIIETLAGLPVGAYGIYDVADFSAEGGRWIIRRDVPAAIPSAVAIFGIAFEDLGLRELRVRTVSTNQPVLSLNLKFGFHQTGIEPAAQIIGGKAVDLVRFALTPADWARARERVVPLARLAETQVREWERAQPLTPH